MRLFFRRPLSRLSLAHLVMLAVAVSAALGSDAIVAAEPRYTLTQTADETVVRIPAIEEQVLSTDLIHALSAVADLDGQAVTEKLPQGDFDLSKRQTRVTLQLVEKALRGRAELAIEQDKSGTAVALLIAIDREQMEAKNRKSKQRTRQWFGTIGKVSDHSVEELHWGLRGLDQVTLARDQPLIVLIHGLQGSHDSLAGLGEELTRAGHACVTYAYPNDGPLVDSSKRLASDLRAALLPADTPLILITHSMGGLVARRMLEDPELDDSRIRQLMMICPPNAGSNLAYLPASLDWHEHLHDRPVDSLPEYVFRSSQDGLNEAQSDLRPDSRFLIDLNARERNPRVRYSILLGTQSPATKAQLDAASRTLDRLTDKSRTARLFAPRLRKVFDHPLELTPGEGDGAVAVQRGRLAGVEDVALLQMTHWTATKHLDDEDGQQLVPQVLQRLK